MYSWDQTYTLQTILNAGKIGDWSCDANRAYPKAGLRQSIPMPQQKEGEMQETNRVKWASQS